MIYFDPTLVIPPPGWYWTQGTNLLQPADAHKVLVHRRLFLKILFNDQQFPFPDSSLYQTYSCTRKRHANEIRTCCERLGDPLLGF